MADKINWDDFEPVDATPAPAAINWDDFEPVPKTADGYEEVGSGGPPVSVGVREPSRPLTRAEERAMKRAARIQARLTGNEVWGAPPADLAPRVANPMVKPGTTPPPTVEERPLATQMTQETSPTFSPPESELLVRNTQESAQARANAPIVDNTDPIAEGLGGSVSKRDATAGDVATGLINEPRIAGGKTGSAMIRMAGDALGAKIIADAGASLGRRYKAEEDNLTPQFDSETAASIYSGLKSTVDSLTVLALTGFAGRGMAAAEAFGGKAALEAIPSVGGKMMMAANLAPLAGLTTADSYQKYRERGATPLTAAVGALGDGAVEALTEMAPVSFLVNKLGKAGFGEFVTGLIAREMPGEQVATFLQDAMDTAIANPNKTWGEFLKERPSAALSTAIAVFTQTAAMGGLSAIANRATRAGQADTQPTPSASTAQDLWNQKIGPLRSTDGGTPQAATGLPAPNDAGQPSPPSSPIADTSPIPASEVLGRPEPLQTGDQAAPGAQTQPPPGSTPTEAVSQPGAVPEEVANLNPEIERVRAAGIELKDWLAQGDVLGRDWSPETVDILTRLDEVGRDPALADAFYKAMGVTDEAQPQPAPAQVQAATDGNAATVPTGAEAGAKPGTAGADQEGAGPSPSQPTTQERVSDEARQREGGEATGQRKGRGRDAVQAQEQGGNEDGAQARQDAEVGGARESGGLGRRTDEKGRELHSFEVNGKPVETHVNPSDAQKEAGNYKKEPVWVDGLKMKFEHGPGDVRTGISRKGEKWSQKMTHPYGYIVATSEGAAPRGKDKDHIDLFKGNGDKVFVIDQKNIGTGLLDEHKVMYDFTSLEEAKKAYLAHYPKGWKGLKHITEVSKAEFREWLRSGDKNKLFSNWHKKVLPQTPVVFQRAGIGRPEDERAVRVMGTGKVVGAPPGKDTIKDRNELVRRLVGLMEHPNAVFEKSHLWYERSGMAIRLLTRGDRALAEKVTRLMAVYSQGNSAGSNVTATIKSMIQIARGDAKVLAGRFPNETAKRIPAILAAPKMSLDVPGVDNKVLNFYRNLIDPATGEDAYPHASTQDRWMMRLMGYSYAENTEGKADSGAIGAKALSPTQYAYAGDVIRRVARLYEERHGVKLKPRQVQGVLWTYVKNADDAVKAKAKGQPFTPKAIDFYDYAVRATAAVTFETIPGAGSTIPGIMNATREQREEYTRATREVTLDEDGNDLIMEAVGVSPLYVTRFGTGSYQGNINPNVITGVVVPGGVKPDMKVANAYAAAVGYVYGQDSVLWHLPNPDGKTVGVALRPLGKSFSKAYERDLYNHIRGLVPGVEFSRVGNEFRFLNLKGDDGKPWSGIKDADFIERIYQAASTFKSNIPIGHADFRADAKLIEGGKNGEGYKARIAASGRPDLQERLDGLKSEVQTVNDDFAKRYGWDKPVAAFNRGSLFGGRLHGAGSAADTSTGGSSGPAPAQAGLRDGGESARAQDQQRLAVGKNTPVFHQRPVQPDAVSIVGIHYGNTGGLPLLSGLSFGSGAKSEEAPRVKAGGIRKRVYFYAQNREGIPPAEGEVYGNHVYRTKLTNILSVMSPAGRSIVNASARLPNAGGVDMNDFERRVVEAGYDGYAVLEGGLRDTAIVLGVDNVPVEYLGTRPDQKNVARFNRGAARLADLDVPGGEPRKYEDEFTRFERAAWVLANFARDEHLFRYPTSKGKSVAEIAKDFNPTIEVTKGPGWAKDMVAAYSIKLPKNKDGLPMGTFEVMVYKNDTIEMNVAGLTSGRGGGSLAYQLVAQYAHNTGKQFLGDRAGLEPIAHARRAEAMVSSYLRTGSTKHFDPHIYMIDDGFMGDAVSDEEMIDTLQVLKKYRNLDDLTKLALTVRYSFGKILAAAPADFGDLRYDFEKNRFYHLWDSTKALGPAYFDELAKKPGLRPIGGGSTSLRRAVIVNTVLHASDREAWARVLAGVRKAADGGNPRALIGLAYDRGAEAGKRFPASDARRTVESVLSKWKNPPNVVLHDTNESADKALRDAGYDTSLPENRVDDLTKGFYIGDTIHMVLPNFDSQRDVMQTLAHEAVGHYGLRALLGKERWQQVVREIKLLKAGGNPTIARLWQDVVETHGNLPIDSMADEVIARAAEEAVDRDGNVRPGFAWFKRLLSHIAEWLRANGFDVKFTNAELAGLLSRAQQNVQRGTLAADAQGHRFDRGAPTFYSALERAIATKAPFGKDGTIPAKQFLSWLEARQKEGAFKKDELEWSGLEDYVWTLLKPSSRTEVPDARVSKADLQQFLDQNGVKVEEVEFGGRDQWRSRMDVLESMGTPNLTRAEYEELRRLRDRFDREGPSGDTAAKFSDYQLPGGENYRELLLTLPEKGASQAAYSVKFDGSNWSVINDKGGVVITVGTREHAEEKAAEYTRQGLPAHLRGRDGGNTFQSSHFDQPNILAHIRFNERKDAEGNRVLFIEEIQSDWAQKGRKHGFTPSGQKTLADIIGRQPTEAEQIHLGSQLGVPAAPFVSKTEAWVALALKRMIRYAADNGFDAIAWTRGDQQAERYDLSKQVSEVQYDPDRKLLKVRDLNDNKILEKTVDQKEIEDYVGKDVAKRLLESPRNGPYHSVKGDGLKVGGEGMRAFYNKIVPNVANDVLKKLGGGKVGEVDLTPAKIAQSNEQLIRSGQWVAQGTPQDGGPMTGVQPGFDITPEMREKAMAGQPLFNRGRANGTVPKTGLLDAALRFPGKYVARFITQPLWARVSALADRLVPEKVKHGLVSDYGLPEPYLDAKMDRAARTNQLLRSTHNLINDIAALDRQQARVAYIWMTASPDLDAENEIMETLPPEARATLVEMKQMVDDIGREAVALGLLDQETYERNKLAYLHRSYKKHEADMTEQQKAARRRAIAIRGDQFKQRGLRDDISAGDLQYESTPLRRGGIYKRIEQRDEAPEGQRGKLRRVIYWPAGKPVPPMYAGWRVDGLWEARWIDGDKVGMWRDFTREEREMMGEIDEVRYAFGQTMIKSVRDVETARFLKWAADNHSVATADEVAARGGTVVEAVDKRGSVQTFGKDEWVEVPGTKIPGTNVQRYGALAGRFVPGVMFNDLRQTVNFQNNVWDKMLRVWKVSKTALSPAVHVNNVMSNFIMADFADVRGRDIARSLITIVKANKGDENAKRMIERFTDNGGDLGNFAHLELGQEIEKILMRELEDELVERSDEAGQLVRVSQVLDLVMHGRVREALTQAQLTKPVRATIWPFRYMIEVYGKEDTVFRLAKFMKEVEVEGKTDREAGKAARDAFLNYEINAPWINALRRSVLPFVAFGYRAIPLIMKTAVDKPWKFAKYAAVAGGLNALVYAILGGDDKDKERRLLPDELSGSTWGIFPRLVRMPWNDPHGSPIFLDVRRWIPAGDVFETNPNSAIPIPSWAMPGGPLAMAGELIANRSMFTGKDIVNETDTKTEKFSKVLDYLWKSFAPNLIGVPGTYATSNVNRALRGETDSLGREKQVPYEVSNAFGVKLRPYPEDQLLANERAKMAHDLIDIGKTVQDLRRQYKRHGLSDEEFKEKLGEQQAKKTARINKYREKAGLGTIQ